MSPVATIYKRLRSSVLRAEHDAEQASTSGHDHSAAVSSSLAAGVRVAMEIVLQEATEAERQEIDALLR